MLVKQLDKRLAEFFLEHPRTVGETYSDHFWHAAHFGASLIAAGGACLLHALLPRMFVNTASNKIRSLAEQLDKRLENFQPPDSPSANSANEFPSPMLMSEKHPNQPVT